MVVNTKTSKVQMGPNLLKVWLENESKPMINFCFLTIHLLISKGQRENIICTIEDVRGDLLGPPHGTTSENVHGLRKQHKNSTPKHNTIMTTIELPHWNGQ